ncbi:MAG: NlpC/P60 family protein [Bacillota bacterium]|nr:NlpC/P60 family protein [Bacillota bacterium]
MRKYCVTVIIMSFFLFIGGTSLQASQVDYTVQSGDSLWSISHYHGISINQIQELNGLQSDFIKIGQVLILKNTCPEDVNNNVTAEIESPVEDVYVIQPGDSLSSIAQKFGTSVTNLMIANGLTGEFLLAGDTLVIQRVETNPVSRAGDRQVGNRIVEYAEQFLGVPYVYGGNGPYGFDCSGFTKYVYNVVGVALPRVASDQTNMGTVVDKNSLLPGDLVFFRCNGASIVNHAGIYVGDGKFIHASSPRSGGVIYTNLSESYYARSYAGARRVLQ